MQDRHPILAVINILISLKVMAIAALFLLFTLVFPLGLLPPGDTADSIYAAAEELGVTEKTFQRYLGVMSKEANLLPEIVENEKQGRVDDPEDFPVSHGFLLFA